MPDCRDRTAFRVRHAAWAEALLEGNVARQECRVAAAESPRVCCACMGHGMKKIRVRAVLCPLQVLVLDHNMLGDVGARILALGLKRCGWGCVHSRLTRREVEEGVSAGRRKKEGKVCRRSGRRVCARTKENLDNVFLWGAEVHTIGHR